MKTKNQYDFVIIGAGIAGLSSAYYLAKDGKNVVVLEQNDGHQNASTNSSAMMSHDPDAKWQKVIDRFGIEGARDVWELSEKAIKLLTGYAHETTPHFLTVRMPAHVFSLSRAKSEALHDQYEMYKKIGVPAMFEKDGSKLHKSFHSYITIPNEGQTNNWSILKTFATRVRAHGGKIEKYKKVKSVNDNGEVMLETGEVYQGKKVIVATGDQTLVARAATPTDTKRTFVIKLKKHGMDKLYRTSISWDNEMPYHYIRSFQGNVLWVGGADVYEKDFKPKDEKAQYAKVEDFARSTLGLDTSYKRISQWSGTFFPSENGLPYIEKLADSSIIVNTSFGGTGILTSFVSGYLIASWEKGKELKYKRLFAGQARKDKK